MLILSEEEAREKSCVKPQNTMCVASDCMAWCWSKIQPQRGEYSPILDRELRSIKEPDRKRYSVPDGYIFIPYSSHGVDDYGDPHWARWVEPKDNWLRRRQGYCGLLTKGN